MKLALSCQRQEAIVDDRYRTNINSSLWVVGI